MSKETTNHALLASVAYNDLKVGQKFNGDHETYTVYAVYSNPATGLQAMAFLNKNKSQLVFAYRGTEHAADVVTDAGMAAGKINAQAFESEVFTARVIDTELNRAKGNGTDLKIEVTGHSLGGSLAQINAAKFGLGGETFNAYGSADLIGMNKNDQSHVVNHVRAGDVVSAASHHYGEVRIYATPEDIKNLEHAGYREGHGPMHAIRATAISAHGMTNFYSEGNERVLPDASSVNLYEANKVMVDQYRSDVLVAGTTANLAVNHPQSMAALAGAVAAYAYTGYLKEEASRLSHAANTVTSRGHDVNTAMHTSAFSSSSMRGSWSALPQPDQSKIAQLDEPAHPGNTLFKQALEGTQRLDTEQGRTPDKLSTNLAGSLAVEAERKGMDRIDHVMLSDDGSRAYAVQGELSSPFKKIAEVQTELGISASIDQSSKAWPQATEQRQREAMAQSMEHASQAAPDVAQPTMGRTPH